MYGEMSDEDRDIDIESDLDDDDDDQGLGLGRGYGHQVPAEKRAHHNALERKRRDHIKESFHGLRDSIPALQGEKSSRAQILKQATDYITMMSSKNTAHQYDIDELKHQNATLESQVKLLEKAKTAGSYSSKAYVDDGSDSNDDLDSDLSDTDSSSNTNSRKKLKT